MKTLRGFLSSFAVGLLLVLCAWTTAYGQITPSGDAYTNTATPTTNLGTKPVLDVESGSQTTYIQFDLSSIPAGYTSASIAKATLKLYVNAVTTAGSFNVDYVNGTWSEKTITASLAPALGTTIVSSVPLASANVHDYVLIDITPAVGAWLDGTEPNDGIALVGNSPLNASFDSKENTTNSHPAELDVVFAGGGTLTGVKTGPGSGLIGGGTSGTLNLGLTNTCAANQVLQWNGSSWACAAVGTGTITGVSTGPGLLGGATSGNVALNLDTSKVPLLAAPNVFTANQAVLGRVGIGTTAPSAPLDVTGGIPALPTVHIAGSQPILALDTNTTFQSVVSFKANGAPKWDIATDAGGQSVNNIFFFDDVAQAIRFFIDPAGNVGIGNSAPTYKLHVGTFNKGLRVEGPPTGGSGMVAASFGGNGDFAIDAPGIVAGRFVVKDSTGNVGIGIPNPGAALEVVATQNVAGIVGTGYSAPSGSNLPGEPGVAGSGGNADLSTSNGDSGGQGVAGSGGAGTQYPGIGGGFVGGSSPTCGSDFCGGDGVFAIGGTGVGGRDGYAGFFGGDIDVVGGISASTKDFKIDHPLDPANKYLFHASVESSEMMNIYTGNVTTDGQGYATVQLPAWFEVLNTDFRYQLTVIGQFAQAIVGRKTENNSFEIRTSAPNVEVSWQVTGLRQDVYAKAHPLVVEQEKADRLRGFYIHPELYGAPNEKQIEWARHPQMMKRIQEMRAGQLATIKAAAQPATAQ